MFARFVAAQVPYWMALGLQLSGVGGGLLMGWAWWSGHRR